MRFLRVSEKYRFYLWRCSGAAVISARDVMDEQDGGGDEFVRAYDADPGRFLEKATKMFRELRHKQRVLSELYSSLGASFSWFTSHVVAFVFS